MNNGKEQQKNYELKDVIRKIKVRDLPNYNKRYVVTKKQPELKRRYLVNYKH